jgi:hypothetical protein
MTESGLFIIRISHSHDVMLNLFQYLVFVEQVQILKQVQDDGVGIRELEIV